jgi:4'-phosphopantetheinyl transferase
MIPPGTVQVAVIPATAVPDVRLPPDELERANLTVHPQVRREFVAGRRLVRRLLASTLGCAPDGFTIALDPLGRPFVTGGPSFSISHCEGWVGVALAATDVGLDLEPGSPPDADVIAPTVMTDAELAAFFRLAREERPGAFARLWVRKEALLKAGGLGFSVDPRAVTAGIGDLPVDPAQLPGSDLAWHVADLPGAGQGAPVGAVALRGHRPVITILPPG